VGRDGDRLSRIVVILELIVDMVDQGVDSGGGLELDLSEDGAFEGLWESLLDLGSTSKLGYELAVGIPDSDEMNYLALQSFKES
jgi:hypothetical protein